MDCIWKEEEMDGKSVPGPFHGNRIRKEKKKDHRSALDGILSMETDQRGGEETL